MSDQKQPRTPKGDKEKQFDVMISVIHDDRRGKSAPVEKPVRYSFTTEAEALEFANKLKGVE